MSLDGDVVLAARSSATIGNQQILFNYAPTSRGPWRLKGFSDKVGRPFSSNFVVVRSAFSMTTLWGFINSPIANAFAYCHLGKRHNIVSQMRRLPVPDVEDFESIDSAVEAYFAAANKKAAPNEMRSLLADVDAAVLQQYDLPLDLEYQILSLFDGWERVGVPFKQSELLPAQLGGKVRFSDFVR